MFARFKKKTIKKILLFGLAKKNETLLSNKEK